MKTKKSDKKKAVRGAAGNPRGAPGGSRTPPPSGGHAGGLLLAALTIGAAGTLGYFGWQYYKKKKAAGSSLDNDLFRAAPSGTANDTATRRTTADAAYVPAEDTTATGSGSTAKSGGGGDFPLKKGSKGDLVRQLQQALIGKYGSAILPKYGADGDFGAETQSALKKKGLPTVIGESTFNVLTQGGGSGGADAAALAGKLYDAATAGNISGVIAQLRKIQDTAGYRRVSEAFEQKRLHGVRQTLVNGLLGSFPGEDQKQKIRMEFIRIGLQYDGSKWSLSGFDGRAIVTTGDTTVWASVTESVQVPAMMVLGNEVTRRMDYTLFENNNNYYLVKTQSVKYL